MKKQFLYRLLPLLLLLAQANLAKAENPLTAGPGNGRSLAEVLNPDGTLRAGAPGSFDARAFSMHTASDGRPVFRPAGVKGAGDERWADSFGLPDGVDGTVRAVVRVGADIYIGGDFRVASNGPANYVAKWDGTAWSSLGTGPANGMNARVNALAVAPNGDVYVGGYFTRAGGIAANMVARWDGTAWFSLGTGPANGVNSDVFALAVAPNGDVYAGGEFGQAGGIAAYRVAKWNGTFWSSLGTGLNNGVSAKVNALAVAPNGDVYVGGEFTQAGSVALGIGGRVARWDGATWNPLGEGVRTIISVSVPPSVYTLVVAPNGDVYVGGYFSFPASNIARWDGTRWDNLGQGGMEAGRDGANGRVYALALANNGDLYIGGGFSQVTGKPASGIAKSHGRTWSPLGTGAWGAVYGLAVAANGDVYAGGEFDQAGGMPANRMAKWDGAAWSRLGIGMGASVNGTVKTVAVAGNGDVYVGGTFTQAGGIVANGVAKWNGTTWSPLSTGVAGSGHAVNAVAVAPNGDVYIVGDFTQAGGVPANNVAKWNGTAWSALGTGTNYQPQALAITPNGNVYVGGDFSQAGGITAIYVAKWDGLAWSSLGTGPANGVDSGVNALAVAPNGDVYVGGNFTQAGGIAANGVAKWDGTAWSPLGTGLTDGFVSAVAVASNGDVYVGGYFNQAGGTAASGVAKWNGTAWSPLGAGVAIGSMLPNGVYAIAMAANGDVYVGGIFAQAGGIAANGVAKWDGTAWSPLGTSTNGFVKALTFGVNGKLYAGGSFSATGDGSKVMVNFGIYDPSILLATATAQTTPAAQLFPNPAHGTATLRLPAGTARQPLTLSDALGRTVRQYPAPASAETVLDLRGLPAGTYLVRCGQVTQRLVVE